MQNQGELKKNSIKMRDLVMIAVGGMVGSAVFTLSGTTYITAGPAAIITWIVAAGILTIYALNLAELASCYNVSGGTFAFPAMVLGRTTNQRIFAGWVAGWGRLWDVLIAIAFTAVYVSQYLGALIPGAENYQIIIAIVSIILICILNGAGLKIMGMANTLLTCFLLLCCGVFIVLGFIHMDVSNFTPFFGQGTGGNMGVIEAIPVAMLGYGCIIAVATAAEEVENPTKNIPKAIFLGISIVSVVYVLMLIATYGMISWGDFMANPAAAYAPQKFAVQLAMPQNIWVMKFISLGALLALFTTLLVLCMDAGRTMMTVARAGMMPKILGNVSPKYGTPIPAIIVACVVGCVLSLKPDYAILLCKSGAMCQAITIAIIAVTVMVHRKKGTAPEGSFRAPGGNFFPILTLVLIAIMITQFETVAYYISAVGYAIGLVIYLIAYKVNRQNFNLV